MKKVLAVWMLMVCTLAAHAQMMGPGYIVGTQQEQRQFPLRIYQALYGAAKRNDCVAFKNLLDTRVNPNLTVEDSKLDLGFSLYIRDYEDGDLRFARFADTGHGIFITRVPEYYYLWKVAREAATQGHLCILKELSAHGFDWKHPYFRRHDVSLKNEHDRIELEWQRTNLLYTAYENKHIKVVNFLLSLPEFQKLEYFKSYLNKVKGWARAEAAKAQQNVVRRGVKASLSKKK